jgi:hypothetical protein
LTSFAVQYKEELIENNLFFNAYIVKIDNLEDYFGHTVYDGNGQLFRNKNENFPILDQKANFQIGNVKFSNGKKQ